MPEHKKSQEQYAKNRKLDTDTKKWLCNSVSNLKNAILDDSLIGGKTMYDLGRQLSNVKAKDFTIEYSAASILSCPMLKPYFGIRKISLSLSIHLYLLGNHVQ